MQKDIYVDLKYIIDSLNEKYFNKRLNVVRIISSFDEFYGTMGYKLDFCLIDRRKINKLNKILPSKKKKGIITFNLLDFCEKIENSETEKVVFYPTELMFYLKKEIEKEANIIFTESLKTKNISYSSMEEIPYVKDTMVPSKYRLLKKDEKNNEYECTLDAGNKKENGKLKAFAFEFLDNIEELKHLEKENIIKKLKSIKAKVKTTPLFTDEEYRVFNEMYEKYIKIINKEDELTSAYHLVKKRLNNNEK